MVRCPTPYPKDMREKIRHARSLAMRQKQGGVPADVRWSGGRDNRGYEEEVRSKVRTFTLRASNQSPTVSNLLIISYTIQPTYKLYRLVSQAVIEFTP